jgi:ornithine cyclodeaminase/alanine dehydrogenase-like protein (mu-crystallin family)
MSKAIDVLEAAFGELAAGTAEMPDRTVMIDPVMGGWIAYMPAYLKSVGALGVKAVTVYKGNPDKSDCPRPLARFSFKTTRRVWSLQPWMADS